MSHKRTFGVVEAIAAVLIVAIIVIVIIFLVGQKESRTTVGSVTTVVSVLDCKAADPPNKFFSYKTENGVTHEVKVTFDGDSIDKFDYNYTGNFADRNETEAALSSMHADYNTYMGSTGVYQEDLTPMFTNMDTQGIINLYITRKTFTPGTAKFVFLDGNDYAEVKKMNINQVEKLYKEKGFSCKINK